MRTLTVKQGGSNWATGWHTLTISKAKYGNYNESKFLELGFSDYPENFTLRIYAKVGKDGEEFAIGNVFRFANAGIEEVMDDGGSDSKVFKINDEPGELEGHEINVLFFKDGEYTRAYSSIAPTIFKNLAEEFTQSDVDYWKGRAERRFNEYSTGDMTTETPDVAPHHRNGTVESTNKTEEAELPF